MYVITKKLFSEFFCSGLKTPGYMVCNPLKSGPRCLLHSRACKSRHNSHLVILQGSSLLIFSHAVREGIDERVRAPAMDKEEQWEEQAGGGEGDGSQGAAAPTPAALSSIQRKKRCICLLEGSCRMPALLASQAAGSIPAFPAAYSSSVINGSKFCACCESRRARAAVPGCEPGIWFVLLTLGAKERLKPALFRPAANHKLRAAHPCAHARLNYFRKNSNWDCSQYHHSLQCFHLKEKLLRLI